MHANQKRPCSSWIALALIATTTLLSGGCAKLFHELHYNAVSRSVHDHRLSYYHSPHTGRIIPREHHERCQVEFPCFGYESTCWHRWPEECTNCPVQGQGHVILDGPYHGSGVVEEVISQPSEAAPVQSPPSVVPDASPLPEGANTEGADRIDQAVPSFIDQTDQFIQPAPVVRMDSRFRQPTAAVPTENRRLAAPVVTAVDAPRFVEESTVQESTGAEPTPPAQTLMSVDAVPPAEGQPAIAVLSPTDMTSSDEVAPPADIWADADFDPRSDVLTDGDPMPPVEIKTDASFVPPADLALEKDLDDSADAPTEVDTQSNIVRNPSPAPKPQDVTDESAIETAVVQPPVATPKVDAPTPTLTAPTQTATTQTPTADRVQPEVSNLEAAASVAAEPSVEPETPEFAPVVTLPDSNSLAADETRPAPVVEKSSRRIRRTVDDQVAPESIKSLASAPSSTGNINGTANAMKSAADVQANTALGSKASLPPVVDGSDATFADSLSARRLTRVRSAALPRFTIAPVVASKQNRKGSVIQLETKSTNRVSFATKEKSRDRIRIANGPDASTTLKFR